MTTTSAPPSSPAVIRTGTTRRPIRVAVPASTGGHSAQPNPEPLRTDWLNRAACRTAKPQLFFPDGKGAAAHAQEQAAKAICAQCPVRTACLSWALDTEESTGVWGGLSRDERLTLGRRAVKQAGPSGDARAVLLAMAQRVTVRRSVRLYPAVVKVLAREVDLRRLRQQGVGLRRCAQHLGAAYETTRLAWKEIERRDAEAAAGGGES